MGPLIRYYCQGVKLINFLGKINENAFQYLLYFSRLLIHLSDKP
jgi:hypothetical protein